MKLVLEERGTEMDRQEDEKWRGWVEREKERERERGKKRVR